MLNIHAFNGLKYGLSILYFSTYFNWRIRGAETQGMEFAAWIFFAVVNSLYTSLWDFFMDWSLGRKSRKHWRLRDELGFREHVMWYYFASVTNVMMRFSWV